MAIDFDDASLLGVFGAEPMSLSGNPLDCEYGYRAVDSFGLELLLWVFTYREECAVFLELSGRDVFAGEFSGITAIERRENVLALKRGVSEVATLFFGQNFHVRVNGV